MELINQWQRHLYSHGIELTEQQLHQFETYYQLLVEWNQKINLTAIVERNEVYVKHFYDSISLSFFIPFSNVLRLADIGSGAGFPSLPLKIVFPHLQVTIVDSLKKRIHFLQHVVERLELENIDCVHGRAEDIGREPAHRDQYDLVTARAVAKLNVLHELCLPFAKVGGRFVAMKGSDIDEEMKNSERSMKLLHGKLQHVHRFELPDSEGTRHIVVYEKIKPTPKRFPRKAGVPSRNPL